MTEKNHAMNAEENQVVYMGIDVHKKQWSVCFIKEGEVIGTFSISGKMESLKKVMKRHEGREIHSVYEAGFSGYYLHYKLEEAGIKNIIVSPQKIPVESGNLVKTDKRDAKKLAYSLSKGLLKGIDIPKPEELSVRQLIRSREALKRTRTRAIQQIKMLLLQYDIELSHGLRKGERLLIEKLEIPLPIVRVIRMQITQIELLEGQMKELEKEAHEVCMSEQYYQTYQILKSIPGIGSLTAAALCFEVRDFKRFSSGKKLCAYLGLTPREYSSGSHTYRGRITGQGNPWLRSYMIESAWKAISRDCILRETYDRLKQNTGSSKKAIVGVARKICGRMHSLVTHKGCYALGMVA